LIVTYETFGQTPLNQEELRGLIPPWVATHADLNLAEQTSIANAEPWCFAPHTRARDFRDICQSGSQAHVRRRLGLGRHLSEER